MIVAAKLIVFDEKTDTQYYIFIAPEAYNALETYVKYRRDSGEEIKGESPLLRDKFQTPNNPEEYVAIRTLIKNPKRLEIEGIKRIMYRALVAQKLRQPLPEGQTRHEVKMFHGLRKFFETRANLAGMKPLIVEKLQGHRVGLNPSYFKPTEQEVLNDYRKAVPDLSVNEIDKSTLQKQVTELTQRAQEAESTQNVLQDLITRQEEQEIILGALYPFVFNGSEARVRTEEGEIKTTKDIYYKNKEGKFMSVKEMYESMLKRVGTTEVATEK